MLQRGPGGTIKPAPRWPCVRDHVTVSRCELKSIQVIGTGSHLDDKRKRRTVAPEPKAIRELRVQLHDMGKAAQPFLIDEARKAYWAKAWELAVVHAATGWKVTGNSSMACGWRPLSQPSL